MTKAKSLFACVMTLRERAVKAGRTSDVVLIDQALANDVEASVRATVAGAGVSPAELRTLVALEEMRGEYYGISPTLDELSTRMGVSRVTVFQHLHRLKEKGVVEMKRYSMRSARMISSDRPPRRSRVRRGC